MTWVYIRTEPGLWTVGFYDPDGDCIPTAIITRQRPPPLEVAREKESYEMGIVNLFC